MKQFKHISWIVVVLVCLLFPAIGHCQVYQVKMRNGRTVKVRQYYEKDGTIFLLRYGNYIGIDKSEVMEIAQIQEPLGIANVDPSKKRSSGTKTSSSQKARRDVVKNSVAPFKRLPSRRKKGNQ